MNLGVNQLALLRRCYLKGNIGIKDVGIYYNSKVTRKNLEKLKAILEKLEIRGLIIRVSERNWILTDFGKKLVEKQFKFERQIS